MLYRPYTGRPRFIALHFIVLQREYIFYNLKVCGNPVSRKAVGTVFPTFVHFASVSHLGSCCISNFFIILYLLW